MKIGFQVWDIEWVIQTLLVIGNLALTDLDFLKDVNSHGNAKKVMKMH